MDNFILEIPNAIPKELCDEIIKRFELDNRKEPGVIYLDDKSVVDKRLKENTELFITNTPGWEDIDLTISKYLNISFRKYLSHLRQTFKDKNEIQHIYRGMFISEYRDTGYQIQRISRGQSYAWHHDYSWHDGRGRLLNCIFYLNTLEENEGGTTELLGGTKIRPEAGKLVLFPSSWTFPHCGNEVKGKSKYIGWSGMCIRPLKK